MYEEEKVRYKPLYEAPKDAKSFKAVAVIYDALDKPQRWLQEIITELLKGNGEISIATNGSVHAYNADVFYVFNLKKWNPTAYPKYGEYIDVDEDGGEVRDKDIYYLGAAEYEFFVERDDSDYRFDILDETECRIGDDKHELRQATAGEALRYLDTLRRRSSELFKLSRKM